jgi:glycosyltransferase involved in cell wall biosynthesis
LIKILFLIRSLDAGGAERQLIELVKGLDKSRFEALVVTFYPGGALWQDLEQCNGVKLMTLGKGGRWNNFSFGRRLIKLVKSEKPDIIHGYLDVPNFYALAAGFLTHAKVIWGIRASNIDLSHYDWTARFVFGLNVFLSCRVDRIIINSFAGRNYYAENRYPINKMVVIPNGIDPRRFFPSKESGRSLRFNWKLNDEDILVGLVGRLDPMKDHHNFIQAASLLLKEKDHLRFVCIGRGPSDYQSLLEEEAFNLGLKDHLIWAGLQTEMSHVYNALDILVLSSSGEGFPNVVGEAMSSGIPCVVTDVGDSARVVGDAGVVVMPQDSVQLAAGIKKILDLSPEKRHELGMYGRERIISLFSSDKLVRQTEEILERLYWEGR